MSNRNRSEGWQHAKLSGHENERLVRELVLTNNEIQNRLLNCAHIQNERIISVEYGGLCEANVDCILGGMTKSKTDLWLNLSNGKRLNVSIKKDEGGQVFLIGIERFIEGFQRQYKQMIPSDVKRAIELYFGSSNEIPHILKAHSSANKKLEERKHRLVADTLKSFDSDLYNKLIEWVNKNIQLLFDFCFSKGLASNKKDWSDIVWYRNLIGENNFDTMIYIPDMKAKIPSTAKYGTRNGGSTIQLPFGFVQWHSPRKIIPGDIQFHHTYQKLLELT